MMIAHGDAELHIASHTCIPTVDGIEICYVAGWAPGGKEIRGRMILSPDEAVEIAAAVEDILMALETREGELPLNVMDEIDHMAAKARKETGL